ncbi:hypothetical protein QWJ07_25440 [Frankia sp. RB7]|nr:hypothetical protein [Frankia sp. RB7]
MNGSQSLLNDEYQSDFAWTYDDDSYVDDRNVPVVYENEICCSEFQGFQCDPAIVERMNIDDVRVADQHCLERSFKRKRRRNVEPERDRLIRGASDRNHGQEQDQYDNTSSHAKHCGRHGNSSGVLEPTFQVPSTNFAFVSGANFFHRE